MLQFNVLKVNVKSRDKSNISYYLSSSYTIEILIELFYSNALWCHLQNFIGTS